MTNLDIIYWTIYECNVQLRTCRHELTARRLVDNIHALWLEYAAEEVKSGRLLGRENIYE